MTDQPPPAIGLGLDCADPEELADLWAAALGYVSAGTMRAYVALFPDGRPGPKLLPQRVAEPKTAKNRMLFDIGLPDIDTAAARLVEVGARRLQDETQS